MFLTNCHTTATGTTNYPIGLAAKEYRFEINESSAVPYYFTTDQVYYSRKIRRLVFYLSAMI